MTDREPIPVCIVNDTSGEDHTGCNAVMDALLRLCESRDLDVIQRLTRRQIADEGQRVDGRAVLTIINGEGSLHHQSSNTRWFPLLLRQLAEEGRAAVLINSVWDSVEFMDDQAWDDLTACVRLIAVRESLSYQQLCLRWLGPLRVVPDLSFWHMSREEIRIALAPYRGGTRRYSDSLPAVAEQSCRERGDFPLPLRPARPLAQFLAELSWTEQYTTARFHGACFAVMAGVPKIVTYAGNCHKIEGLVADVNAAYRPPTEAGIPLTLAAGMSYCKAAPRLIEELFGEIAMIAAAESARRQEARGA